ncbi:MAG: hipA, partial [Acidobacteria bacterium]|nr:hipA [Acidobacteriota bacterium]
MSLPADVYRLYEGLPQQGPGSDALTLEALRRLGPLPDAPRVLDLGCGSGRQTLALARALGGRVVAVDDHEPFLRELDARARAAGLSHVIETRLGDMGALDLEAASADLAWSEGAIYIVGFERGLRAWRRWLRPGGLAAVSECSWLVERPGPEVRAFWDAAYPAMGTIARNAERARAAGYEVIDAFPLPASAWWDGYYTPLLARAEVLAAEARDHAALAEAIADVRREVELFERFGDTYGYVFYLLRRQPVSAGGDGRGLRAGAEAHLPPHGS